MIEDLVFGTPQLRAGTTRVDLRPGDPLTIGLGVTATSAAEVADASAFVWTNYGRDDPQTFEAVPMPPVVPRDNHQRAFEVILPAAGLGTFLATAYLTVGGQQHWATTWYGTRNLVFLPSPEIDRLYVCEVPIDKANARADSTDISTIDDMLGDLPGATAWPGSPGPQLRVGTGAVPHRPVGRVARGRRRRQRLRQHRLPGARLIESLQPLPKSRRARTSGAQDAGAVPVVRAATGERLLQLVEAHLAVRAAAGARPA